MTTFSGLFGLPADDDEWRREQEQKYGWLVPEKPSAMARVGRGMTDIGEALAQAYYNLKVWDPSQADTYRRQRAEDERLYQRGLTYAHRIDGQPLPDNLRGVVPDFWRMAGQSAAMLPVWWGGAAAGGTAKAYQALANTAVAAPLQGEFIRQATYYPDLVDYYLRHVGNPFKSGR